MIKLLKIIFALAILIPTKSVWAEVYISEIAWMGTMTSSSDEWIELGNDGSSQNLSGWKLSSADGSLDINLSGTADGFFLIERTDDEAVPGVTADLIASFGSGLSNEGEDLILTNSSGDEIDRVSYQNGWPAGDNTTKETMQKSGSSWITSEGTPRSENEEGDTTQQGTNTNTTVTKDDEEIILKTPVVKIFTTGVAIAGNSFTLKPFFTDESGAERSFVKRMEWNFGDGTAFKTNKVSPIAHTYKYTGSYIVYLDVYENYFIEEPIASAKITVEVTDSKLTISSIKSDGAVEIKNTDSKERDLSLWSMRINGNLFVTLPKRTTVPANGNLILAAEALGITSAPTTVDLLMPNGTLATSYYPKNYTSAVRTSSSSSSSNTESKVTNENISLPEETQLESQDLSASVIESNVLTDKVKEGKNNWPYFAGFAVLAGGVVYVSSRIMKDDKETRPSDDYTILSSPE